MRPAFSSTKQAAAFALLLLVVLLSPVLAGKKLLPPREQAYAMLGWNKGAFPWVYNQIFQETNPIDIAIVGSSHIWYDINTPYLQQKLSEKLHRPAVVRTVAWGGAGYDGLYFITRDLLAHRQVRQLVFYDETAGACSQNMTAPAWFRFGEDAAVLPGLELPEQGLLYFSAVIGMPRNLLSLFRPNLPAPLVTDQLRYWLSDNDTPHPATQLGCLAMRLGFTPGSTAPHQPFESFVPATTAQPGDVVVYAPATQADFKFTATNPPAWEAAFAKRLTALLRAHGVQSVMVSLPLLAEARSPVILESAFWPEFFSNTTLLGIPPAKFFGPMTDVEKCKLYSDPWHLNQNGQAYYTTLVTPALIQLYENQWSH
jgi:hypothetical protein